MRTRLRLGAAAAVALGALLLATVLASPALAWHSNVTANAFCKDDRVRVHWTVDAWEEGHQATVDVFYQINGGERVDVVSDEPLVDKLTGNIDLANDISGEITVTAVTHWQDSKEGDTTNSDSDHLPKPGNCQGHESTTSTSESTTSTSESTTTTTMASTTTESSVAPTTSIEETTTTAAVGAATSTTAGTGQLPFTGASSGPMLLAGIALVGGGSLFLLLSRSRDGHATK